MFFLKTLTSIRFPGGTIGAKGVAELGLRKSASRLALQMEQLDPVNADAYLDYRAFGDALKAVHYCAEGVPSPELPTNCYESTATPGELYKKLDEWGIDSQVIPHGTTWGWYTPPNASWEHQLNAENMEVKKQVG